MISISYIQCYCHFLLEVSQRGYSVYYGESTSIVVVVVVNQHLLLLLLLFLNVIQIIIIKYV